MAWPGYDWKGPPKVKIKSWWNKLYYIYSLILLAIDFETLKYLTMLKDAIMCLQTWIEIEEYVHKPRTPVKHMFYMKCRLEKSGKQKYREVKISYSRKDNFSGDNINSRVLPN